MTDRENWTVGAMGNTKDKQFSSNLLALQLQVKTLLEESGGDRVVALLDALCGLSPEEQRIVLRLFVSVTKQVERGEIRLEGQQDEELKRFENGLYRDLLHAFQHEKKGRAKLELVEGRKNQPRTKAAVIDMSKYRQQRSMIN